MRVKSLIRFPGADALYMLTTSGMTHFPEAKARRILNIAWEFGNKAEPCPGGYVHVYFHGEPGQPVDKDADLWSVVEHIGPVTRKWDEEVVIPTGKPYTERNSSLTTRRKTMPPRRNTRTTAPAPAAEANGSTSKLDKLEKYLTGNITPTLQDYAEWFRANVAAPDKLDSDDRLIALAVTFYGEFQASDFNKEQKEARRQARETAAPAEPEPATPARGRASKPAAAKPTAGKPGPARRGRKPAAAATSGAAVY